MWFLLVPLGVAAVGYGVLRMIASKYSGADLSKYDAQPAPFSSPPADGPGMDELRSYLFENFEKPAVGANSKDGWVPKRERFDQAGLLRTDLVAEYRADTITVQGREISGAWTLIEGYDPDKRVLYMHGGAFSVGSDLSHRPITWNIAKRTGAAVFTPNYRLMPENPRMASIEDARAAYLWILENGPDGPAQIKSLALAGDSAGGNLALMLANWARKNAPRQPDAVVALSPTVDTTLTSPTFKANLDKDQMLRPLMRQVLKTPRTLLLPAMAKMYGMNPSDTAISPIYDDLGGLPPTLIQASQDEMLFGDGVRYAGKMKESGSPVTFQGWTNMPHVWQIFDNFIPSPAGEAHDEIGKFLNSHL